MQLAPESLIERCRRPAVVLAIAVAGCLALMLLPERWMAAIKHPPRDALRPAQEVVRAACARIGCWTGQATSRLHGSAEAARLAAEVARLSEENRRLVAEVSRLRLGASQQADPACAPPLVAPRPVEARVLGRQALGFLGRAELLDVGQSSGAASGDLVVAAPLVLDCGRDQRIEPGQAVLVEDRVWGRIAEVGRHTSLVRRLVDAGYRDLVQIVGQRAAARGVRRGPHGVLEGTGGALARISRVEITEPVEVGDLVYTAAELGVLPQPVLCGTVVRVERSVGSACWDIWMAPPADRQPPERLAVLTFQLNALRTASASTKAEEAPR